PEPVLHLNWDQDGDGLTNPFDNCPRDPNPDQLDTDGDRLGNVCDADDDNDFLPDSSNPCPVQADCDGDGWRDGVDNCMQAPNRGRRTSTVTRWATSATRTTTTMGWRTERTTVPEPPTLAS
ncbi:MAG: thrombospondin type 3 repeat-containing protein, partial [bacterium]